MDAPSEWDEVDDIGVASREGIDGEAMTDSDPARSRCQSGLLDSIADASEVGGGKGEQCCVASSRCLRASISLGRVAEIGGGMDRFRREEWCRVAGVVVVVVVVDGGVRCTVYGVRCCPRR
jgi:hypothetical protein